jgi:hypothetical protein
VAATGGIDQFRKGYVAYFDFSGANVFDSTMT